MRTLFTLLAALAFLPGCASRDPLAARQKAYERLASFIEPGMTRRQLYALLPPQRPATLDSAPRIYSKPWLFGRWETYPLDSDFALKASFLPKTIEISQDPLKARPANPDAIEALLRGRPLTNKVPHPALRGKTLDTREIDELLFGIPPRPKKPIFSKQDPDDTIDDRPEIIRDYSVQDSPFRARPH